MGLQALLAEVDTFAAMVAQVANPEVGPPGGRAVSLSCSLKTPRGRTPLWLPAGGRSGSSRLLKGASFFREGSIL